MSTDTHDYCWNMLPWLVTGRLATDDEQRLQRHLLDCAACRAELEEQRSLCERFRRDEPVMLAPQASLQKLMARIEAGVTADSHSYAAGVRITAPPLSKAPRRRASRWLLIAAAVQTFVIAVLLGLLWRQTEAVLSAPRFATLTSPQVESTGATLRVVFKPDMTAAQLQSLLQSVDAQVVAGPTEAGVYTLQLNGAASERTIAQALARVRADPRVIFAERVSIEERR